MLNGILSLRERERESIFKKNKILRSIQPNWQTFVGLYSPNALAYFITFYNAENITFHYIPSPPPSISSGPAPYVQDSINLGNSPMSISRKRIEKKWRRYKPQPK
jgi:hypothetical protein